MTNYSETTNLDQILQRRVRDDRGKAVYARTDAGDLILNGAKKGVPLGDVWDIPYLNPKARERVGYPTQKPVLLLERIIGLCTDPNDVVLDPFCGSGTTLVAAILLGRIAIGIDTSEEALSLTRRRLEAPERTTSRVLEIGRDEYARKDIELLENLRGLPFHAVHRNRGIDAILSADWHGKPVCVRIQRPHETIEDAASALCRATECKGDTKLIVVVVDGASRGLLGLDTIPEHVLLIPSAAESIRIALEKEGHQSGLDAPSTATDRCALGLTSAPLRA
jgi:site-specific DNA-methyltransferase (adenine-specific)